MGLRFRVLGSGSSGNATLVEAGETRVLIDAGLGPRVLAERLASAGIDPAALAAILLSHEHNDHARGAAAFSRKWGVPLWGTGGTYAAMGLGAEEIPAYRRIEPREPVSLGELRLEAVTVPHDAAGPVAFVLACNGARLGHATDLGQVGAELADAFRRCDAVLIESNYDPGMLREGPYPWSLKERILSPRGHLSNGDVGRYLAEELGESCRAVVLAHLSRTNNHPEVAGLSAEAALRRRGRREVRLTITDGEGTDWIAVPASGSRSERSSQLPLF